ncbi:DUF1173 family protein [Vibrio vulnificus]|nr:DUF1173 family protein [Vibrio vulnificus]
MHTIFIVDKKQPDTMLKRVLNPQCLLEVHRREEEAQALLCDVRELRQELRCTCLPKSPARMFVRLSHGFFTIVNHPEQGLHSESCQLFTTIHGFSERDTSAIATHDELAELDDFVLHRQAAQRTEVSVTHTEHTPSASDPNKESTLGRLFKQLVERSLSHWYYPKKATHVSPLRALRALSEAAKSIAFGEYCLNEWIFYGSKGVHIAKSRLRREASQWKGSGRPHAIIMLSGDRLTIDNSVLHIDRERYSFKRLIWDGTRTQGAHIAFLSLAYCQQAQDYVGHTAYVHPVVSTSLLMPVDSAYERSMAEIVMRHIDDATQFKWSLQKPIFSKREKNEGLALLPDFILQSKGRDGRVRFREIIEVLGMLDDPKYVARKARTVPMMPRAWRANSMCEVDPSSAVSIHDFDTHLRAVIS